MERIVVLNNSAPSGDLSDGLWDIEPISSVLLRTIGFVFLSFLFITATLPGLSFDHSGTTDREEEYERLKKQGRAFSKEGKLSDAIQCFKAAADVPHSSDHSELYGQIMSALEKAPLDPDSHLALGIYCMNLLDLRFRDPSDYLGNGQEAEWEFKTAKSLSPSHENAEADALLTRLDKLREAAQLHDSHLKWYEELKARKPFLGRLLTARWNPPSHEGFLTTRVLLSWFSSEPIVVVKSGSEEYDRSALDALRKCLEDFPNLYWGQRDFIFASESGFRKAVEDCPGSVVCFDPRLSGKPQRDEDKLAEAIFEKYFTRERLQHYCKPETEYAYKCGVFQLQTQPDSVIRGELKDRSESGFPVTWTCASVNGKALRYEYSIGYKWAIVVDALNLPTDKTIDDYILLQRIRDALFSCLINYENVHFHDLSNEELTSRLPPREITDEQLVRNDQGMVVAYKCALKDGRIVTAELDLNHSPKSVVVNGNPDALWTEACNQAESNIRPFLGCDPVPIVPAHEMPDEQ